MAVAARLPRLAVGVGLEGVAYEMAVVTFRVRLKVRTLTNAPFNHNKLFVKWKTPRHVHSGCTSVVEVQGHTCRWDDEFTFDIELRVDSANVLRAHFLRFSVRETSSSRGTTGFSRLGICEFDLASVVGTRESFHRVLLHQTKANETLHFSLYVQQLSGAPTFRCPPLAQLGSSIGTEKEVITPTGEVATMHDLLREAGPLGPLGTVSNGSPAAAPAGANVVRTRSQQERDRRARAEAAARAAQAEEDTLDAELRRVQGETRSLEAADDNGERTAESIVHDVLDAAFQ